MAAGIKVYKSGAWHPVTKISVYHSGAWVEVLRIRAWKTVNGLSGWRDVYIKSGTTPTPSPSPTPSPTPTPAVVLSVTITPTTVGGHSNGGPTVVSTAAASSASGGTAPYTYHWEITSWSASSPPVINSPDSASTTFTQNGLADDVTATATARVTVVDSKGNVGRASVSLYFNTSTRDLNPRSTL